MAEEDRPDIQKIKPFKTGGSQGANANLNLIGNSVKYLDKEVARLKKKTPYVFTFCVDGVLRYFMIRDCAQLDENLQPIETPEE